MAKMTAVQILKEAAELKEKLNLKTIKVVNGQKKITSLSVVSPTFT